jgi:hypothetical protein
LLVLELLIKWLYLCLRGTKRSNPGQGEERESLTKHFKETMLLLLSTIRAALVLST